MAKLIYEYVIKEKYYDGQITISSQNAVYSCSFGLTDQLEPIKYNHTFSYASLTKPLIALEILDNEDDIENKHVINYFKYKLNKQPMQIADIKVKDLMKHQAGISKGVEDQFFIEKPDCLYLPNRKWLYFDNKIGNYNYSNTSYCLLGKILEMTKGKTLAQIFGKYGFSLLNQQHIKSVRNYKFILQKEHIYISNLQGAGGLQGTALNYHSYIREKLFLKNHIHQLGSWGKCNAGALRSCVNLVFYVHEYKENSYLYWRNGALPSVTNIVIIYPEGEIITVFLADRKDNWLGFTEKLVEYISTLK